MANALYLVLFVVLVVLFVVTTAVRMRRGGPGPAVQWVPRVLRPRLNEHFRRRGWQPPYDEHGNRNPDRDAI